MTGIVKVKFMMENQSDIRCLFNDLHCTAQFVTVAYYKLQQEQS